jgi:hypothetical protein
MIDENKMGMYVSSMDRRAYEVFVGNLTGKRPLGRPRRRWKDNITVDLKENVRVWNGFMWLRIGACGALL